MAYQTFTVESLFKYFDLRTSLFSTKCLIFAKAEEKRRQEEEEILSKKLHEEQALHEAQLKEVCLENHNGFINWTVAIRSCRSLVTSSSLWLTRPRRFRA